MSITTKTQEPKTESANQQQPGKVNTSVFEQAQPKPVTTTAAPGKLNTNVFEQNI